MTTERDLYCAQGVHFVVAYGDGEAREDLRHRVTAALTEAGFTPTRPKPPAKPPRHLRAVAATREEVNR